MKTIWTITVKTSLPDVSNSSDDLTVVTKEAFESFDAAKARIREIIKSYTFEVNAMFDGKGNIENLDQYMKDYEPIKDDEEIERFISSTDFTSDVITYSFLKVLQEKLRDVFFGRDTELPFAEHEYDDIFLWANYQNGEFTLKGHAEGPCNGIDPYIKTNMFDMTKEQDYMLYINDYFSDAWYNGCSAELYIDLQSYQMKEMGENPSD